MTLYPCLPLYFSLITQIHRITTTNVRFVKAIGLGLVVLLPLANPLTTVALFLGLAGNMNSAERNRQSLMASVYVFAIMMVAYYAGQLVWIHLAFRFPVCELQAA